MALGSFVVRIAATLLLFAAPAAFAQPYTWEVYAGSEGGDGSIDATGTAARLEAPWGIAIDGSNNVYVLENGSGAVRVITAAGAVTTLVRRSGDGSSEGRRNEAGFGSPRHPIFDASGNLLVPESGTHSIRRVTPTGLVTTFAGEPFEPGTTDGPLATARFRGPTAIARHPATGDLYVSDQFAHTIRKITVATGEVSTFAGIPDDPGSNDSPGARFDRPHGLAFDGSGNLYVADTSNHKIRKITPDGVVSTFAGSGFSGSANGLGTAASFSSPDGLAFYGSSLFVADMNNHKIRAISSTGNVFDYAGSGEAGYYDAGFSSSRFRQPAAIAFDSSGNLFVAEMGNSTVRKVTGSGVTTLAGKGFDTTAIDSFGVLATFFEPHGIVADSGGNLYVGDQNNSTIRKITPGSTVPQVTTFAGTAGVGGTTDATGTSARFVWPSGLDTDGTNLFVADPGAHTIRKIVISTAAVTTVAGTGFMAGSDNGNGSAARFNGPSDVAVDPSGNLYVADLFNHTIRKIDTAGNVTTFAGSPGLTGTVNGNGTSARFNSPHAVATDGSGNVYVADTYNHVIRKIDSSGNVTTYAGAMEDPGYVDAVGTEARFQYPEALDYGNDGYLYVSGSTSFVRRINVITGEVTTLGGQFFRRQNYNGTATLARFGRPSGFTVHDGVIYLTDRMYSTVRKGTLALNAAAAIDSSTGSVGVTRQLSTVPNPGTFWQWRIVRRPTGSTAELSSPNIANPTFTPDIPDAYTFRLLTTTDTSRSITEVSLTVACNATTVAPAMLPHPVTGTSYSQTISATGGSGSGYVFEVASGSLPPGLTLAANGTLSGVATTNGSYTFTVRVRDSVACLGFREYTLVVAPITVPASITATGSPSPLSVALTWPAVSGAAGYKVYRRSRFADWALIASPTSTSYNDASGLTINEAYAYRVRAYTESMVETADSPPDFAHTMTEDPITPGTVIYTAHMYQLRSMIRYYRQLIGVDTTTTDADLIGVPIKAIHVQEIRDAFNDLMTRVGRSEVSFTDPSLTGLPVKALHFTALRDALR